MSSANADVASPTSPVPGTNRASTIRQKLLRSHLLVAGLGVCLLVASLVSTIWLRATTVHLAEARGASEYLSMRALSGLHRSEAALRSWVVGGSPIFAQQREAAWNEEIHPAIEELQSLSLDWEDPDRHRFEQLVGTLNKLQDSQWWVADVAQTPGNEPAQDVLRRDIDPLETSIVAAVTELIDIEKNRLEGYARGPVMGAAADFRWMFTDSNGRFHEYVASGDPIIRDESLSNFERAFRNLDKLIVNRELQRSDQMELVDFIRQELSAWRHHVRRVIELRQREDWNVARHRLRTEVDPLAREADTLLTEVSRKEHALMLRESEQAKTITATAIGISTLFVVAMLGVAWFLSDRGATRIAKPVTILTAALEELTAGRRAAALPVPRDDELGRLTHSFNTMAAALQRSEARLEAVYKTATDGIITIDTSGTIQSATNITAGMFGYSRDELLGRNVSMLMPSPHRENHDRYLANFLQTGDAKIIDIGRELVGRRKNGEEFPIHLSVSETQLRQETFFTGVVSDISRRQRAETERFNLGRILDESLNEIYVFDTQTLRFLYVNRGACDNLQYTMDELRGLTPVEIEPIYTMEMLATLVAPLLSGELSKIDFETIHLRKDGTTYPVEVHLQTSRFEQLDVFVAIILDITERKQAEAELRRMSKTFSDSVEAIFIKDLSGRIIDANPAAERQYGWARDELLGRSIKMLVPPEEHDLRDVLMDRCFRGEEVRSVECTRITKSGKRFPVALTLSLMTDDADEPIGIVTTSEDITRRKEYEAQLRIKDNAIQSAVTGVAFGTLDGTISFANPAFVRMFGYEHESEVVGRLNSNFASAESVIEDIMGALQTRGFWRGEDIAQRKDGSPFPIELSVALMKDADGVPIGMVATFIDISRRRQAEEALRESESRFRSAFDDAAVAMSLQDVNGRFMRVNPSMCQLVGYSEGELLTMEYKQITHPDDLEVDQKIDRGLLSGKHSFHSGQEKRYIHKSGHLVSVLVSASVVSDEAGHPLYRIVQVQDITERKQAEELLRANEERLRSIVDTAADPIITINKRGIVESFNPAAERTFHYAADEVLGHNIKMLMPPPYTEEHDNYLTRYLETGEPRIIGIGREVVARRKDGSTFPMQLSVSEVQPLGIFTGIVRDLTNEKRSQERLLQSERLAAIGEAMAGLVHESRNAMASVQAQLRMLSRRIADRPELSQYIDGALKSQFEVQKLFEEVRQWAAPKKLDIQPCNLAELVRRTWEKLEPQRTGRIAELHEQHESIDLICEADEFSLAQVFRNIFENALAACDDPVEVDAEYGEVEAASGPALRVTIRDNGPGLSAEQRERVFEAFYTTKTQGTGLGMPIAQRTMHAHAGNIEIGPETKCGAAFTLTIPRKQR